MGKLLKALNLRGSAAELGVKQGYYTSTVLRHWRQCAEYVQVDVWSPLSNYNDHANVEQQKQREYKQSAKRLLDQAVSRGYATSGVQCQNFTTNCAAQYPDEHFDFIYVDARHDRLGVLDDLVAWYPKLRRGGVMAGHDYTTQQEPSDAKPSGGCEWGCDPSDTGQNWTINYDGTIDASGRVVRGAVDDFFSGKAPSWSGRTELRRCPLQVVVTYRESAWNTWLVAKPWRPGVDKVVFDKHGNLKTSYVPSSSPSSGGGTGSSSSSASTKKRKAAKAGARVV